MISSAQTGAKSGRNGLGPSIDTSIDAEDIAHLTGVSTCDSEVPQLTLGTYTFKCANTDGEFRQIHELNYRTFVEEVGQYPDSGNGALVDKFHDKNRYFIALSGPEVVGMIATHDEPPFSVARRMPDPEVINQLGKVLEARLLAIKPGSRNSSVFRGMLWLMFEFGVTHGYDHLVISGIAGRTRMYERMGFTPLGPAVKDGEADFVPMKVRLREMPENILRDAQRSREQLMSEISGRDHDVVSLLPGPVELAPEVQEAMTHRPVSHRGNDFIDRYEAIRRVLREMAGGLQTAIMAGSGTLANEVVAASLAADPTTQRGIVLNNGEFGRRLAAQAARYPLRFDTLVWDWGVRWDFDQIRDVLKANHDINWIWAAHLETSVSLVNDIDALFDLAGEFGVRVCLDCVSSFGAIEVDVSRAHLATAVSGKAIGAIPGLAFIFAADAVLNHTDRQRMPQYLDLPSAMEAVGPRYTVSSSVLDALDAAMELWYTTEQKRASRYAEHEHLGSYIRRRLKSLGFTPLVEGPDAASIITSFTPPANLSSRRFCELCAEWGFEISGLSGYLEERGIVQIATMGAVTRRDCARLFTQLRTWMRENEGIGTEVNVPRRSGHLAASRPT